MLYPIGVPLFFWSVMWNRRNRLQTDAVRAQIGILYAGASLPLHAQGLPTAAADCTARPGYRHDLWWFEMVDLFHKLALTSLMGPRGAR